MDSTIKKSLEITACKVRMGVIEGVYSAKSGHPGGSLSISDVLGASIDEITTVYTMGSTAFMVLGGERDHSFEKWQGSKELYDIAKKAVSDNRNDRYQSLNEFIDAWSEKESVLCQTLKSQK